MHRLLCLLALACLAPGAHAGAFRLDVAAADASGRIARHHAYDRSGCHGDNVAPAMRWSVAPAGTRSFAVTVHDPDAPTAGGFWHWVVIDLPADARGLPEGGGLPGGARSIRNDYGNRRWGGPCPPAGDRPHHYRFTVYALDVPRLDLAPDAAAAAAVAALRGHVIAEASQTLIYGR